MFDVASQGPASYRPCNALGFLLCAGSLIFALSYLEGRLNLDPCPLCTATRLAMLVQAGLFLIAFIHNPQQLGQRLYASLGLVWAAVGLTISAWHLWLQSLPASSEASCKPGLARLFNEQPFGDAVATLLSSNGECALLNWQLLGLTLPQQALLLFALLCLVSLKQLRRTPARSYFS